MSIASGLLARGDIVYSQNTTTGFKFVGVVLKAHYSEAQIQFCSSYDGLQSWPQTVIGFEHLEFIGRVPDWADWDTCDVNK